MIQCALCSGVVGGWFPAATNWIFEIVMLNCSIACERPSFLKVTLSRKPLMDTGRWLLGRGFPFLKRGVSGNEQKNGARGLAFFGSISLKIGIYCSTSTKNSPFSQLQLWAMPEMWTGICWHGSTCVGGNSSTLSGALEGGLSESIGVPIVAI